MRLIETNLVVKTKQKVLKCGGLPEVKLIHWGKVMIVDILAFCMRLVETNPVMKQ